MSTQKYGRELEDHTAALLEEAEIDVTMGSKSGSAGNPASNDIFAGQLQIECKRRNEDGRDTNTIIQRAWWKKVCHRAAMNGKFPAIVTSQKDMREAMVTLRLRDFIELMAGE